MFRKILSLVVCLLMLVSLAINIVACNDPNPSTSPNGPSVSDDWGYVPEDNRPDKDKNGVID